MKIFVCKYAQKVNNDEDEDEDNEAKQKHDNNIFQYSA